MRLIKATACAVGFCWLRIVSGAILFVFIALAPAAADDLDAISKRYEEFLAAGNYPAALIEAQRFEAGVKARFGVNHADYGAALNNLARVYMAQGKYADAEGLFKRALAIYEKTQGPDRPNVAHILTGVAAVYTYQGKYADAEGPLKRALTIYEKARGVSQRAVANTLSNLAIVYTEQGKYADAEPLYQRSLAIREKALGKDHPDVAESLYNLANAYGRQGKYADAERLYKRALAIYKQANHPDPSVGMLLRPGGHDVLAPRCGVWVPRGDSAGGVFHEEPVVAPMSPGPRLRTHRESCPGAPAAPWWEGLAALGANLIPAPHAAAEPRMTGRRFATEKQTYRD
jgi:tetratricopeptide (TPR) repeat protein